MTFTSPNYPKLYDSNETCEWLIRVEPSHRIRLNLLDFDLENTTNCNADVLVIYDGPEENSDKIILRHCGNSLPNQTEYFSTSNEVLVVFNTNHEVEYKGFKANYTIACGSKIVTGGSGMVHLSDITKLHNYNCMWTIVADDLSKHVTLTMTHLTTIFTPDDDQCFFFIKVCVTFVFRKFYLRPV